MFQAGELRNTLAYGLAGLEDNEIILTAAEYAKKHGYAFSGIRTLIKRGKIPRAFKFGREWYIPEKSQILGKQYNKKPK